MLSIPFMGYQKIIVRKNFRKPDSDLFFLRYLYDLRFDKLPDEVYEEYSRIRQENVEQIKKKFERAYGKNYELIKSDIIQILKIFGGKASLSQISMIVGIKKSDLLQVLNTMVKEEIIEIDNSDNKGTVILKSEIMSEDLEKRNLFDPSSININVPILQKSKMATLGVEKWIHQVLN